MNDRIMCWIRQNQTESSTIISSHHYNREERCTPFTSFWNYTWTRCITRHKSHIAV